MSKFYILSVKKITKETHNSVSVIFNIPSSLKDRFSFIPGQYITVQKELNGEKIRRDYSICSSQSSGEIKIGVKAVENGTFSQYATSNLKEGDELEVSAPLGRFNLQPVSSSTKNHIAFAAGSGITPVLSIVKSSLEDEENSKIVLVYGNKTIDDVMFKADIDALAEKYQERFFVYYTFSKASYNEHLFGRIDTSVVKLVLNDKHKDLGFSDYFLCGPEAMIKLVKETIIENGVDEDQIHFELFTTSSEDDIPGIELESLEGETEITILLDDEEETFTMDRKNTILESVLLKGLDAPYSCQGGICSSCLAKVTEGKAVMDKNSILSDEEVSDGFVLTCQAHPTTPKIIIDYDDV
jgi:ring-1,2-phenylacetyl-CoA epoxidase subunit PaaE